MTAETRHRQVQEIVVVQQSVTIVVVEVGRYDGKRRLAYRHCRHVRRGRERPLPIVEEQREDGEAEMPQGKKPLPEHDLQLVRL